MNKNILQQNEVELIDSFFKSILNKQHNNLLIHGNCLDKMKFIPDKSIDLILTDLPYEFLKMYGMK